MFKELLPILAEGRKIKVTLESTADRQLLVYIEPLKKNDGKDLDVLCTPFLVRTTAEELDAQLPDVLAQWVAARLASSGSVQEALESAKAELKAAADDAKKKAADTGKKAVSVAKGKPAAPAKPAQKAARPVPTLALDAGAADASGVAKKDESGGGSEGNESGGSPPGKGATAVGPVVAARAVQAAVGTAASASVVAAGSTVDLF